MNALDSWRQTLRRLIPRGFLRRDQGNALFASDYPRFPGAEDVTAAIEHAGFRVVMAGGVARIDGNADRYRALFRALPCPAVSPTDDTLYAVSLGRRLAQAATAPDKEPLDAYPPLLKALDEGKWQDAAAGIAAYAAVCQRQGSPLPSAAGKLILLALTPA